LRYPFDSVRIPSKLEDPSALGDARGGRASSGPPAARARGSSPRAATWLNRAGSETCRPFASLNSSTETTALADDMAGRKPTAAPIYPTLPPCRYADQAQQWKAVRGPH
jgi:hypothetical protein